MALVGMVAMLEGIFYIGSGRMFGTSGEYLRDTALAGRDSIAFPETDEFFRLDIYDALDNLGMYWHVPVSYTHLF